VDLKAIAAVKRAVKIPVIGNGDIVSFEDAAKMLAETGCDAVAVGRGALGNPGVFARINAALEGLPQPPEESAREKAALLREQAALASKYKGEYRAMTELRKHIVHYVKGLRGAAGLRRLACSVAAMEELERFIELWLRLAESQV
ncbi:MAG: tRNA-dihydrouridine synthase, partial [Oscillospiraceae bacterium]|nr:tRNA-dihydrouridine synthase [Oscillospiraceae bacterium]